MENILLKNLRSLYLQNGQIVESNHLTIFNSLGILVIKEHSFSISHSFLKFTFTMYLSSNYLEAIETILSTHCEEFSHQEFLVLLEFFIFINRENTDGRKSFKTSLNFSQASQRSPTNAELKVFYNSLRQLFHAFMSNLKLWQLEEFFCFIFWLRMMNELYKDDNSIRDLEYGFQEYGSR